MSPRGLEDLNEKQREAVTALDGPTLVLAGAGSGKTRVIVHRIAYLVGVRSVPPESILAVTFTNKAAGEMRRRVEELLGRSARELSLHTFHALCLRLLRRFGEDVGLPRDFLVYGEDERRALLRRLVREAGLVEKELPFSRVSSAIGRFKERAFSREGPLADPFHRVVAPLAASYQERLDAARAVDFDDLLLRGVELLECSARAQDYARRRFASVLVDEYQDTNRVQYRLLRLLAPHGNVFVVGDEDQSIYNFRGADLRNILDFERDFPGARVVKLELNYRSTASILRAASGVIRNNRERKGKTLVAQLEEGERVSFREDEDEREEAARTAAAVQDYLRERPSARAAVLFRTRAQSRVIEEELVRRNVAHRVFGGVRFYDRREIKDALAYVRLLLKRDDDGSFLRVVNVPSRGIGEAALALLKSRAEKTGSSLWDASLALLEGSEIPGRSRVGLAAFRDRVERLAARAPTLPPSASLRLILSETGLFARSESERGAESRDRLENLEQLVAAASEYEESEEEPSLPGFLDSVGLLTDADGLEDGASCSVMTIHAAKGLEFDAVFLTGLEEGLFPHVRATADRHAIEEERRLFYVGLTRARSRLVLSCARLRRGAYLSSSRQPSRFLSEIPPDALSADFRPPIRERGGASPPSRLRPGALVRHDTFGEGRVVQSSGSGRDRKVTVVFSKAGRKRLVALYANLEVLS